jgi:NTE family protein
MRIVRIIALVTGLFILSGTGQAFGEEKRPTVALVLEGGSAWGFAHIGVLKVIEELGIPVDIVVGTSMGSIVGALYAAGYTASEIAEISDKADWTSLFLEENKNVNRSTRETRDNATYFTGIQFDRKGLSLSGGLIAGNRILRFFDSHLINVPSPVDFDSLTRRYRAVATDILTGERVVFSEGALSDAMRASMSIPGVFEPYYFKGRYLVDGGVVDNLPVALARELGADIVIAVDLYYGDVVDPQQVTRSPIPSLVRTINIMTRNPVEIQLPLADYVMQVDMKDYQLTDFVKSAEITALGEKTARENIAMLTALRDLVADTNTQRAGSEVTLIEPLPPVTEVTVSGSTSGENARIRKFFEPVIGTIPDGETLDVILEKIDTLGGYKLVRVRRNSSEPGYPLEVTVTPQSALKNEFKTGFLTETTYSKSITNNLDIVSAAIVRGLTTKNSELRVEAEFLDTPDVTVSFIQDIGNHVSFEPFYSYARDSTTQIGDSSFVIQYQTTSHSTGGKLVASPNHGIDFYSRWHYDWITEQYIPDVRASTDVDSASIIEAGFDAIKLDSPVFPMDGIDAHVSFKISLKQLGSERYFQVLEARGSTFLSLHTPFSVAFLWTAGTDFSVSGDDPNAAPPFYKPDLAGRRLFPGPLSANERIGNHVAGLGLEIKNNLNWKSRGITLPVFAIAQVSVGAVIQNPSDTDWNDDVFHGDAALGLGMRVNDGFGASIRIGAHRTMDHQIRPFVAIDLGSIGL